MAIPMEQYNSTNVSEIGWNITKTNDVQRWGLLSRCGLVRTMAWTENSTTTTHVMWCATRSAHIPSATADSATHAYMITYTSHSAAHYNLHIYIQLSFRKRPSIAFAFSFCYVYNTRRTRQNNIFIVQNMWVGEGGGGRVEESTFVY